MNGPARTTRINAIARETFIRWRFTCRLGPEATGAEAVRPQNIERCVKVARNLREI